MREFIENLNPDRIIGLIGFILTGLSLIYAFRESKKNKVKKSIILDYGVTCSIFKNNPSLKTEELKLLWNNKEVGNIFQTEIYLKNSGNTSLKNSDFLKPIKISFQQNIELLKTNIYSSSEFTKLKWNKINEEIIIDVDLLEKKKIIRTEIVYSNEMVSPLNIDIAILDGNIETVELKNMTAIDNFNRESDTKFYSKTVYITYIFKYFFPAIILLALIKKGLDYYKIETSILTNILVILPIIIICFYVIFKKLNEAMTFSYAKNWVEFKSDK
jgi:hypothetical protein